MITLLTSQHVGPNMRGEELLADPNVREEELLAGHSVGEEELEIQVGLAVGSSPR